MSQTGCRGLSRQFPAAAGAEGRAGIRLRATPRAEDRLGRGGLRSLRRGGGRRLRGNRSRGYRLRGGGFGRHRGLRDGLRRVLFPQAQNQQDDHRGHGDDNDRRDRGKAAAVAFPAAARSGIIRILEHAVAQALSDPAKLRSCQTIKNNIIGIINISSIIILQGDDELAGLVDEAEFGFPVRVSFPDGSQPLGKGPDNVKFLDPCPGGHIVNSVPGLTVRYEANPAQLLVINDVFAFGRCSIQPDDLDLLRFLRSEAGGGG